MYVCCARFTGRVCTCKDGSDVLYIYLSDVHFRVSERCICKGSEDVQTYFSLSVDVVYVLPKRHSSVVGYSKSGRVVGI